MNRPRRRQSSEIGVLGIFDSCDTSVTIIFPCYGPLQKDAYARNVSKTNQNISNCDLRFLIVFPRTRLEINGAVKRSWGYTNL